MRHFGDWMLLKKSLDFMFENRLKFKDHTFYAHNGGFYDLSFLFREGLLTDERFKTNNCIEGVEG